MPSVRTPGYCRRTGGRFDLPDEPTNSTESKSCPWTAFSSAALIPLTIPLKGKQGQLQTEPAPSSIAHALEPLVRALCRSSLLRSEGISSMLRQEDLRTHHRPSSQQCWDTAAFLSQQQSTVVHKSTFTTATRHVSPARKGNTLLHMLYSVSYTGPVSGS